MKFTVTFKTPDAIADSLERLQDTEFQAAFDCAKKFVKYDELITVEFDTEKGTATVLPAR